MNPSANLFLIGPSGGGKTSVGRRLAAHYGMPFVDLDHEIEERTGADISAIFDIEGEPGFRKREAALLDELTGRDGIVLATGAGAILDAPNREHLAARGFVLWLDAGIAQQLEHLAHDRRRPLLAGGDRRARLTEMAATRTPLYASIADLRVSIDAGSVARAAQHARRALAAAWTRPAAPVPAP